MTEGGKRVEAAIKPELLVWARESAGLSPEEAAHKAQVKPEQLLAWEAGDRRPTIHQLRTLGSIYKRPLAVFFLSHAPKAFQPMHDFRRLPGEVAGIESPRLRLEIRRAEYRRQVVLDLYALRGEAPPSFTSGAKVSEDPEVVGGRLRATLNLSYRAQTELATDYDAWNAWRAAVEGLGVLVCQAEKVDVSEMRGFSLAKDPLPVIVTNIKDAPRGRIFTLLHELVHLLLSEEGLCDLSEHSSVPPEERKVEVFANRVAAAVLMPAQELLAEDLLKRHHTGPRWSGDELLVLSRRFQVSQEAMLRRLLTLGRTTPEFYQAKREEFLGVYKALEEKERAGFAPPDRMAVATAGPTYVRLVLSSYYQEHITTSDLCDFLGVRLKHVPKIEAAVLGHAPGLGVAS